MHTKIFRKEADHQTCLNINSEHPKSSKHSISYSQTLRIKWIYSTKKYFEHHSKELKWRFLKQGYDQKLVDQQLEKVVKLVRDDLLKEKDREQQDPKRIPLILTINFYRTLQQVFTRTGTSSKPTKICENNSKNNRSQPLRETKI